MQFRSKKNEEIYEVMEKINLAASNGHFFAYIKESLYPETNQKLEEMGYKVIEDYFKNSITWEE